MDGCPFTGEHDSRAHVSLRWKSDPRVLKTLGIHTMSDVLAHTAQAGDCRPHSLQTLTARPAPSLNKYRLILCNNSYIVIFNSQGMIHHQTHSRPTESYFLNGVSESVVNWQIRRHEDCLN